MNNADNTSALLDTIADAFSYVEGEFRLTDGAFIDSEMWAEGFAFSREGQARGDRWAYQCAREALPQLTTDQWASIQARGAHMRACGGYAGFDRKGGAR